MIRLALFAVLAIVLVGECVYNTCALCERCLNAYISLHSADPPDPRYYPYNAAVPKVPNQSP